MKLIGFSVGLFFLMLSNPSAAVFIECGVDPRIAFLGEVSVGTTCETGLGNPQKADIDAYFGGDWNIIAELEGADGVSGAIADGVFSADITHGEWGSAPVGGTWDIASSYWDTRDSAILSMHIGNGGGDPDHFAWGLLTEITTNGVFGIGFSWLGDMDSSWAAVANEAPLQGAGLSNFKLWGTAPVSIPTPPMLTLLVIGLIGFAFSRRKIKE